MSILSGFYDSVNHDRTYDAERFSSVFDGMFTDGVFSSYGECFKVESHSGMTVVVQSGRAWFNKTWTLNEDPLEITLPEADLILNRIDAVVLEVNRNSAVRSNTIKMVSGNLASSPIKPVLIHDSNVDQYALSYIFVGAGSTEITENDITNNVGTKDTPYASGILINTEKVVREVVDRIGDQYREDLLEALHPIGSIYTSTRSTNPSELFGGSWELISGRFLVGDGECTDENSNTKTFVAGESGGVVSHILQSSEIVNHTHNGGTVSTDNDHIHQYEDSYDPIENQYNRHTGGNLPGENPSVSNPYIYGTGYWDNQRTNPVQTKTTSTVGTHTHDLSLGNTGSAKAHNNMPPYLVVYIWKRVA